MSEPAPPPSSTPLPPPAAVALVRDLLFASKISGAGQAAGVTVKIVRDPARLAAEKSPLLLVDLNQPGAIEAAAEWGRTTGGRTVGFVSHVDTATVQAARAAGIGQVMARGHFVQVLGELLRG